MRGSRRSRTRGRNDPRISAIESLSEEAVKRDVRRAALKHPATIVSLILSIVFFIIMLAPPFLGPLVVIILLIISAIASVGSFFWRSFLQYDREYARRTQELLAHQDQEAGQRGQTGLQRLKEDIQTGFSRVNSSDGLKALQELVYEYEELQPVLDRGRETDPLAVAHIPGLAEETYRQGLGVLVGCLDLMREIGSPNNRKLEAEVVDLQSQIGAMENDDTQTERLSILKATVASHQERLALVQRQSLRVDGLLHQSDSCEASLHRTRIELAALKADNVDARVSAVTDSLQSTINQAKEVQEELKKLGLL